MLSDTVFFFPKMCVGNNRGEFELVYFFHSYITLAHHHLRRFITRHPHLMTSQLLKEPPRGYFVTESALLCLLAELFLTY